MTQFVKHVVNRNGYQYVKTNITTVYLCIAPAFADSLATIQGKAIASAAMAGADVTLIENGEALAVLPEKGVTIYDWSQEDRNAFREAAVATWATWADKTPDAAKLVDSHKAFIERIGLGN